MNTKRCLLTTAVVAALAMPFASNADPIYIETPANGDGDANFTTDVFTSILLSPNANSIYTEQAASAACPVCAVDGILKNGEILAFTDTTSAPVFVDGLVPLNAGNSREGFNNTWQLSATYSVSGLAQVVVGADKPTAGLANGATFGAGEGLLPAFAGGVIDVFFEDFGSGFGIADGTQLLRLNLVPPGTVTLANVILDGIVDYGFLGGGYVPGTSPAIENFFHLAASGSSFYSIAGNSVGKVFWRTDFNVDPNLVPFNHAGSNGNWSTGEFASNPFPGGCPAGSLCRGTNLNLSVQFTPEPATLALLGLGLVGLAASRRYQGKRTGIAA